MARNEVWIRTDSKLIRSDALQAVEISASYDRPTFLVLRATGEKDRLVIRIQPEEHLDPNLYADRAAASQAAWQRAEGLDVQLLARVASAAMLPGGAVVYLDHDERGFPVGWRIEPLVPAAEAK